MPFISIIKKIFSLVNSLGKTLKMDFLFSGGEKEKKKYKKDGIIRIRDNSKFLDPNCINEKTYNDFVDQYMLYKDTDSLIIDIKTVGGLLTYSLLISEIISRHKGRTIARIEYNSFSGGTVIALACDKIMMTRAAAISCIDPQANYLGSIRHAKRPLLQASTQQGWIGLISQILTNYFDETDTDFEKQMFTILRRKYTIPTCNNLFDFFMKSHPHSTPLTIHMLPEELRVELYEPEPEPEKQEEFSDTISSLLKTMKDNPDEVRALIKQIKNDDSEIVSV
jgi:hypothetical protein